MREFIIRRLRRSRIIAPLWDEYDRMQVALKKALAERDAAIADRVLVEAKFKAVNPLVCSDSSISDFDNKPKKATSEVYEAIEKRYDEVALLHDYQRLDRERKETLLESLCELHLTALTQPWKQEISRSTTQADIAALFRLILGRNPHPLEWSGHLANYIGQDVQEVTRTYLTSLEFSRNSLLEAQVPSAIELASLEGFKIFAARDDRSVGVHVLTDSYEPHVTAIFRKHLRPGMQVIDIGANIGYFTMLAASLVGSDGLVTAVEANPDNAKFIEASRRINNFAHVKIANVAAGRDIGLLSLHTDHSNGVTASLPRMEDLWGTRTVPCLPLQNLIRPDRRVDFIKIDIEGAEYLALSALEDTLKRDRPMIVSEFAPDFLTSISGIQAECYLRFFLDYGLELAIIDRDGSIVTFGSDVSSVMRVWEASGTDHIDILAAPPPLG